MFLKQHLSEERNGLVSWEDLGVGAPTIIGLARLCGNAIAANIFAPDELSLEAKTILFAARDRGVIEIKASNNAFDAVDRFLAVFVELDEDRGIMFRRKPDPEQTIRYLDAFRELCAAGLILHHLYREFSLNRDGFRMATAIPPELVRTALEFGVELERHQW